MIVTIQPMKLAATTVNGKQYLAKEDIVTWFLELAKDNPTVAPLFAELARSLQTGVITED